MSKVFCAGLLALTLAVGIGSANGGLIEPATRDTDLGVTESFDWSSAVEQSFFFLTFQHAFRLTQDKTASELNGPFFGDYWASVRNLGGWGDGDSSFTNYVAHPMQGAVSGYIQIQNDPRGASLQFSANKDYWKSRLKATGWAAIYSTQFELGPYSEASIGNVGLRPGTMGYVDLVVTPIGGLGWVVGEDAVDRFVVQPMERKWNNRGLTRFLRVALSPTRSFANVLRFEKPWKRDGRR
jgi:hypothetical protein